MQKVTNILTKQEPEYDLYNWHTEWLRCKQYIEDAVNIDNVGYNIDDVEENIANGTFQLWPGKESAVVTFVAQYPKKSILSIIFSGG